MNAIEEEACWLAQRLAYNCGYAVFPVATNKHPTCPHGFNDASKDAVKIRELWHRYPGPLIGIATGAVSGIDVLDIDRKPEACSWWHANHHRIPATRTYRSRSGGLHLYFRHADGLRCSGGRVATGIDVKADGGCCTLWFASGEECNDEKCSREKCLDHMPPARWPDWLLNAARPPPDPPAPPRSVVQSDAAVEKAISAVVAFASTAKEGQRNAALFWATCRLGERARAGQLGQREAEDMLIGAAKAAGIDAMEARSTIRSGLRRAA